MAHCPLRHANAAPRTLVALAVALGAFYSTCAASGAGDAVAYLKGESAFVPVRFIFEWLGAEVDFRDGSITAVRKDTMVRLKVGSKTATVNGQSAKLTAAPLLIEGKTYVPLRFVAESFGAEVEYSARGGYVTVAEAGRKTRLDIARPTQRIAKVFVYPERGDVFAVYADGTKRQLTRGGQCALPRLAPDKRTVGWLEGTRQSNRDLWYLATRKLRLYRDGQRLGTVTTEWDIFDWKFVGEATNVALSTGSWYRSYAREVWLARVSDGSIAAHYNLPEPLKWEKDEQFPQWARGLASSESHMVRLDP